MGKTASIASYTVPGKEGCIDPLNEVDFKIKVEPSRTLTLGRCQKVTVSATTKNFYGKTEKLAHSEKLNPGDTIKATYNTVDNALKLERLAFNMAYSITHNDNLPSLTVDVGENHDKIYKKTCEELEKVTGIMPSEILETLSNAAYI